MPGYYEVANWEEYQHYSHRNPPWIRLYYSLLTSEAWVVADDAGRALLVAVLLVASRHGGRVPADPNYIRKIAALNCPPDFAPLVASGFLIDASKSLASCVQDASSVQAHSVSVERERVNTDTETEHASKSLAKGDKPVRARKSDGGPFAEIFPGFYAVYPRKRAVDDARKAWGQVVQTEADVEMVRRALPVAKAKWAAEGTDEKHIPYPASWLRSGDWKTLGLQNPPGSGSRRRTIQDDENEAMLREIGVLPPLPGTEAVNG